MTKTTLPAADTMYRAFVECDSHFEGVFFTAVKTTGIFCRPTCRAKKPLRENIRFFASTKEAIDHGYRPCKICRPMEPAGSTPRWVGELLREAAEPPWEPLRDRDLRARGLQPDRVRRWFKRNHGMTFHSYLRQMRINRAYGAIRDEASVTDTAFDSGYGSLSGFGEAFRRATGFAPSHSSGRCLVTLRRIPTPLGPMLAGAVDGSLCLLEFADRPMLETQLTRVAQQFTAALVNGNDPILSKVETQLGEYFAGRRRDFNLPLALGGSEFQRTVWEGLRAIPYGETRSYRDQARSIGRPEAVRAVARANGDNRIAIIVPCHRVVGSDGSLTGYGGGLWRKRYLLDLEGGGRD